MVQRAEKKTGKRSQAVSAKRQAILTAALNIFSQYGIHGTRLEQVAEQAGVSKGLTAVLYGDAGRSAFIDGRTGGGSQNAN